MMPPRYSPDRGASSAGAASAMGTGAASAFGAGSAAGAARTLALMRAQTMVVGSFMVGWRLGFGQYFRRVGAAEGRLFGMLRTG